MSKEGIAEYQTDLRLYRTLRKQLQVSAQRVRRRARRRRI
jgi:hypothetical protein